MSAGLSRRRLKSPRSPCVDELPPFAVRRFTVAEYHRLIDAGILQDGDPYELLDGWITRKMTHNPAHDVCVDLLGELFMRSLPKGWRPLIQSAISLSGSEPEPDIAIVRGAARDFLRRHPTADDLSLIIEVADSSLDRERVKANLYAQDTIPRYWLVNLAERVIEDHSRPTGKGSAAKYSLVQFVGDDETISVTLGKKNISFAVKDILP